MPRFYNLSNIIKKKYLLITIITLLAICISYIFVYRQYENSESLPIKYSQDISAISRLKIDQTNLDYLLVALPASDFPRYLIKYKNQKNIISVKVPNTTHMNIEREILLKNNIPYAIAEQNWINDHPEIFNDKDNALDTWQSSKEFLNHNAIGILLLSCLLIFLKKGISGLGLSSKVIRPDEIKGSMDDLIGMEDIKREINHLEDMILNREIYKSHNIDKPFNIMLTGPAGTGKTRLAGYLAKKLGIPLIQASGSGLETGLVGGGSKAINDIYKKACAQGRCLIFLDEAQSLFMRRGRGERKWDDDTTNTLLSLLDGIKSNEGNEIIWVVASNFDDINSDMDDAMLRRFSVKINFRFPNKKERVELLKNFLQRKDNKCIDLQNIDFDYISDITVNISPAAIEAIINRASLISIEENKKINTDILLRAFERTSIGLTDRATNADSDKQRERVAIHELGHFFIQIDHLLKKGFTFPEIKSKSKLIKISTESVSKFGALGFVLSSPADSKLQTLEELEQEIMEFYGGVAAEEFFYGVRGISIGSQNDIQKATVRLELMINQLSMYSYSKLDYRQLNKDNMEINTIRQLEKKSDELYASTVSAISKYAPLILKLKTVLLERYVLSKEEIFSLLGEISNGNLTELN